MAEDRRRYDPFAPHQRRARGQETSAAAATIGGQSIRGFVQAPAGEQPASASPPADLESMRKAALIQLAEERGLDSNGTKAELVERLRAAGT